MFTKRKSTYVCVGRNNHKIESCLPKISTCTFGEKSRIRLFSTKNELREQLTYISLSRNKQEVIFNIYLDKRKYRKISISICTLPFHLFIGNKRYFTILFH